MFRGEPDEILAWSEDILTLVATGVEDFLEQKIVISATDISMIVSHSKIIWRYLQRVMHVIVESINVSH